MVVGIAPALTVIQSVVADIAVTDIPVLIVGESGVGKDTYARSIHRLSKRAPSRFWNINCSAPGPDVLLAQLLEIFGALEKQDELGSIYLDNLQELEPACQRTLLAQLMERETANSKHNHRVRFISSATSALRSEVETDRFRRALYFRLNGVTLQLPPLRERCEDIPALMEHFLAKYHDPVKRESAELDSQVFERLAAYDWPGNIRELENVARKIAVFSDARMALDDLPCGHVAVAATTKGTKSSFFKTASRAASQQAERELIRQALERTKWNRKRAARELQISYKSLLYKIKQIGPLHGDHQG